MCSSRKDLYYPHGRDWKILGKEGVSAIRNMKQKERYMYESQLEFAKERRGGGGFFQAQILSMGENHFLDLHFRVIYSFEWWRGLDWRHKEEV